MAEINLNISKNVFCPKLYPLLDDYSHRFEMYMGSAGSGKSYFITQKIIVRCLKEPIRVLVCRRYATTIRNTLQFIEKKPHYYGQVPVSVFNLNRDNKSIFHKILSLQDAYNSLSSSEVDDYEAFVDAYLVLMGVDADNEDLQAMKENRVILLPPSDANAAYLTKNFSDTQIENILQNINDNIHKISASPDFNDENFMAQTGIAMRYKLISFENNASNIASNMKKAIQKRIELIAAILNIKSEETVWRDVDNLCRPNYFNFLGEEWSKGRQRRQSVCSYKVQFSYAY